jgi:YXYXY domain-containing protein
LPAIFADQSLQNDNIVDWIFLELRNAAQGNSILQTRSALIQRDGDIVDVDGKSAVTFNNVPSGNYTVAIRHRNHLGISTDPATYTPSLDEKNSTLALVDFASTSKIYGGSAAYEVSSDGKNVLWAGNANMNHVVRFSGIQNDKDYILLSTLQSNPDLVLPNVYSPSDVNMDGRVIFNGLSNDKDFIFTTVLQRSAIQVRTQSLP